MTENLAFSVLPSPSPQRTVIAAKNSLPGELISSEKVLLSVTCRREGEVSNANFSGFSIGDVVNDYNNLSVEDQAKVTDLEFPQRGPKAQQCHGRHILTKKSNAHSYQEAVTLNNIVAFNSLHDHDRSVRLCCGLITRLNHSCIPNCAYKFVDESIVTVRCIRPVQKGEELTISYLHTGDMDPAHERRYFLLRSKEFLCKCSRCISLGDDTRQFNCFNQRCTGRHLVCQPTNYEGCEPFLLPCTKCKRVPTGEQERSLFQLEARLPEYKTFVKHFDEVLRAEQPVPVGQQYVFDEVVRAVQSAPYHALVVEINILICRAYVTQSQFIKYTPLFMLCNKAADKICQEHPSEKLAEWYWQSSMIFGKALKGLAPCLVFGAHTVNLRKGIRMLKILRGREYQPEEVFQACRKLLHKTIQQVLELAPEEPSSDHCNFCHETPTQAFMLASRCGACRRVMYCSKACQAAHWPIHKSLCKLVSKRGGVKKQ